MPRRYSESWAAGGVDRIGTTRDSQPRQRSMQYMCTTLRVCNGTDFVARQSPVNPGTQWSASSSEATYLDTDVPDSSLIRQPTIHAEHGPLYPPITFFSARLAVGARRVSHQLLVIRWHSTACKTVLSRNRLDGRYGYRVSQTSTPSIFVESSRKTFSIISSHKAKWK